MKFKICITIVKPSVKKRNFEQNWPLKRLGFREIEISNLSVLPINFKYLASTAIQGSSEYAVLLYNFQTGIQNWLILVKKF